jgi:XTP/dITP diphosphohydrolase
VRDALDLEGPRSAHFICALSLAWPDGHVESVQGRVDGQLNWPPRGDNGFGYDPMFIMDGKSRTFGEISRAEKEADNHRARAFVLLRPLLPPLLPKRG